MTIGPLKTFFSFLLNGVYVLNWTLHPLVYLPTLPRRPKTRALIRPITGPTWPKDVKLITSLIQKPETLTVSTPFLLHRLLNVRQVLQVLENGRRSNIRLRQLAPNPPTDLRIDPPVLLHLQRLIYIPAARKTLLSGTFDPRTVPLILLLPKQSRVALTVWHLIPKVLSIYSLYLLPAIRHMLHFSTGTPILPPNETHLTAALLPPLPTYSIPTSQHRQTFPRSPDKPPSSNSLAHLGLHRPNSYFIESRIQALSHTTLVVPLTLAIGPSSSWNNYQHTSLTDQQHNVLENIALA